MLRQALAVAFVLTAGMAARAADAGKVEQKPYKSVLILGMFNGPQDAERLKGLHDPKTHQPYDRIFAFGTSLDGKKTFFEITRVAAGEGIRVGMDNFAIRPTDTASFKAFEPNG